MRFDLLLMIALLAGSLATSWLLHAESFDPAGLARALPGALLAGSFAAGAVILGLRKSRRRADRAVQAIDSTNDGYWVLDAQGAFVEVNDAYCRILGYTKAEVLRMKIADFEAVATQDRIRGQIQRILRNGNERFETRHRHRDGRWIDLEITVTAVDRGLLVAFLRDVSQRKAAEERINSLAFFDPLTSLPNRRLLRDRIDRALAGSERSRHHGALLFIDLDNFKLINDTRGHGVGDELLVQAARRLVAGVRAVDTVARQGGDEFVILLEMLSSEPSQAGLEVANVAEKARLAMQTPFELDGAVFHVAASIGVALFQGNAVSTGELEQRADTAMYRAKTLGRNRVVFFEEPMLENLAQRTRLEASLRDALHAGRLLPHFQPQVDVKGRLMGAELLLRWHHPQRGWVPPGEFIPLAEETGLIVPLGRWVLEEACAQLSRWRTDPATQALSLSVNVSPLQFVQADFVEHLRGLIAHGRFDPRHLQLELTEGLVTTNLEEVIQRMQAVRALGLTLSMDDFGTGQSSLSNLRRLPIQCLKIDRVFVKDLPLDAADVAIVSSIILMAGALGLDVLAEGVETDDQRLALQCLGCFKYQGYLFGHPVPLAAFESQVRGVAGGLRRSPA